MHFVQHPDAQLQSLASDFSITFEKHEPLRGVGNGQGVALPTRTLSLTFQGNLWHGEADIRDLHPAADVEHLDHVPIRHILSEVDENG